MTKVFSFVIFTLLYKTTISQDNTYKFDNAPHKQATYIIDQIEKNNIDSIYSYFDPLYLKKEKEKIKKTLTKFHSDFLAMHPKVKRDLYAHYQTGYNLFRFRYFDSTGTVLQLDLSYKNGDIKSKVCLIETVSSQTFKKLKETSLKQPQSMLAGNQNPIKYPTTTIIELRNCSNVTLTSMFTSQLNSFKNWVYGRDSIETNKMVQFSPKYQLDSSFIKQNILTVRQTLPKNFWNFSLSDEIYNNRPNQDSIWFMHLYVQIDKDQNIEIFSAYKITFEGNDATIKTQRINPKITNVEFILDKKELLHFKKRLKNSKKVELY